jgi:hypothetical protein
MYLLSLAATLRIAHNSSAGLEACVPDWNQ